MARSFLLVAVAWWLLSCFLPCPAVAQRSYYRLKHAPHFQYTSSRAYVYPLPVDSVFAKVYLRRSIQPSEAWLEKGKPYEIPAARLDSLLASKAVPCGYYLYAFLSYGQVRLELRRKAWFTHDFIDLREVRLLVVRDTSGRPVTDAAVLLNKKIVAYDTARKGYPLPMPKKECLLQIRCGQDLQVLDYSYVRYRSYDDDYNRGHYWNGDDWRTDFSGYLVTNKPCYLPGDTVRYKAYLLNPRTNHPYEASVSVAFRPTRYYQNSKEIMVQPALRAAGPGVYFGEFILGDSVKVDETYQLTVSGDIRFRPYTISQYFKVEDYLLNEVRMRVTGEGRNLYQHGDSVHLYAHAFDANQLPISDGRLQITVTSSVTNYETPVTRFIPDTLYRYETDVDASGETYLGFATADLPPQDMTLDCHIRLFPANAEVKDTFFSLAFTGRPYYFQVRQEGNQFTAELIRNKKSVSEKGLVRLYRGSVYEQRAVRFPFKYDVQEEDKNYYLEKDTAGGKALPLAADFMPPKPEITTEYNVDTATFYISNPMQSLLRYTVYEGNTFRMYGSCRGDTVLRLSTRKGRSVTLLTHYTTKGVPVDGRYVAARLDRELNIRVDKKDIVFPGQADTIGLALKDGTGKAVPGTNVTVLAFNSQFEEDFIPLLESRNLIRPSLSDRPGNLSLQARGVHVQYNYPVQDASWLPVCRMDTSFFYRDVYLNRDGWACFQYPLEGLDEAQLAIYLRRGTDYHLPAIVYIDEQPVYYGFARSFNAEGLRIQEGVHSIRIRTDTGTIYLHKFRFSRGQKYLILLNEKNPPYFFSTQKMPATLTPGEADNTARRIQLYQLLPQYPGMASVFQHPLRARLHHTTAMQIVGPLRLNDTVSFFQYGNTRINHEPEVGQVFSFRPQMTRVERTDVYQVLAGVRPGLDRAWPQIGWVTPPTPYIDQIWPDSLGIPRDTVFFALGDAREKDFMPLSTETVDSIVKMSTRIRLHYTGRTEVKSWLLKEKKSKKIVASVPSAWEQRYVPPGTYSLCVILADNRCQLIEDIRVQANGLTIVPVQEDSTAPRYTWATLPRWIAEVSIVVQEVKQAQAVKRAVHYDPSEIRGPVIELYGTITDEQGEPLIAASVEVMNGGIRAGGAVTDIDGKYSIKPLSGGIYTMRVFYVGYKQQIVSGIELLPGTAARIHVKMEASTTMLAAVEVKAHRYAAPLLQYRSPGTSTTITKDQIKSMPTRSISDMAATAPGAYQRQSGMGLSLAGGRSEDALYTVDGIQTSGRDVNSRGRGGRREDEEPTLRSEKGAAFINAFLGNMSAASGLRRDFRDWAIWEPDLWTDKKGNASFRAEYPDNITSWKTYVLAMNPKGYSGRSFTVIKAFKPLAAQLYVPRFLRYGDSVDVITKIMNYTGQPFSVSATFLLGDSLLRSDSLTVHNARNSDYRIVAPAGRGLDTLGMIPVFRMRAGNGYMDGEERKIPVLPVGMIEYKGLFGRLMRDTVTYTRPDTLDRFNGRTRIFADASLIDVMLREIDNLKVYPHGCTEQVTTKLLAISYEEEIKRLRGNDSFSNTETKKSILEQLVKAQNADGSFGWFRNNNYDSRITNYVLRTLQRLKADPVTELMQQQGCRFLAAHLDSMTPHARLAALVTLSGANYAVDYKRMLDHLQYEDTMLFRTTHNQLLRTRICQQQHIPCDSLLDMLSKQGHRHLHGISFGEKSYNWYYNDMASTVLAYLVFAADNRYEQLATRITDYLLFRRRDGYYGSTAESGQVLSALLPGLLKTGVVVDTTHPKVYVSGSLDTTIRTFPAAIELKDKTPDLMIRKTGGSPVYLSVLYGMLNPQPQPKNDVFSVESYFLRGRDTLQALKQGEKVQLRVVVKCHLNSDYVHIDIPLPAGCVPVKAPSYRWPENSREQFRDRVSIYCGSLSEGTYTFDVPLEVRFKGSFNMNPVKVEMMYFPDQYGCNAVKKVRIR